jgi:hypothetical protein
VRIKLLQCFFYEAVNPAFATCPPPYKGQFLAPSGIRQFARDPDSDLTRDFLAEALSKGDECFGILDGGTLAAYSWYSTKPTRIDPRDLFIEVDGRYIYMYRGFTLERFRGQRLHAIGKTIALQSYLAGGKRGMISYVEFVNAESLKSTRRMGGRLFGSILILGLFGHYLVYRTRGCRRFGVRIGPLHPALGVPSPEATSLLEAE